MLKPNCVYHGNALDLLHAMQVEGLSADGVICDPMYGVASVEYDTITDPSGGDPEKHWAYHQPIVEAARRVLRPGGALAFGQGIKFRNHFQEWFGPHRQWIIARTTLQGYPPHSNLWVVQTRERQPIRPPDDDAIVVGDALRWLKKHHPCPKPVEELEYLVKHLTKPGDLVVDVCCGLGSTLKACQNLGRGWIGCDLSLKYTWFAKHWLNTESLEFSQK